MKIKILPDALDDLAHGFKFYESQENGLGEYFLDSGIQIPVLMCSVAAVRADYWITTHPAHNAIVLRLTATSEGGFESLSHRWLRLSKPTIIAKKA